MKEKMFLKYTFAVLCLLGASSCTHYQTQGAVAGGVIGAAAGAIVGDDSGDVLRGAAIGAAGGAGAAALDEENKRRMGAYNQGGDYYPSQNQSNYPSMNQPAPRPVQPQYRPVPQPSPQPPQSAPPNRSQYPVATKTADPNIVLSPFDPTREIGVKNYKSGDLARDPKNQKIFRIP